MWPSANVMVVVVRATLQLSHALIVLLAVAAGGSTLQDATSCRECMGAYVPAYIYVRTYVIRVYLWLIDQSSIITGMIFIQVGSAHSADPQIRIRPMPLAECASLRYSWVYAVVWRDKATPEWVLRVCPPPFRAVGLIGRCLLGEPQEALKARFLGRLVLQRDIR